MMNFAQIGSMMGFTQSTYDADYQALLDRATTLGYTHPSTAQKTKQNQFVLDLKSAGIWNSLDILYVFATDGSATFAQLNWKTPASYEITQVNTPTFTTNEGFDFNGTNQYLDTNWAPGTHGVNYTQNDASYGVFVNENVGENNSIVMGCSNNADGLSNGISLQPRTSGTGHTCRINDNTAMSNTNANTIGFYQVKRLGTSGTRKYAFKDGLQLATTATTVSTARPTVNLFLGATNGNGTATLYSSREISMAFAGNSLNGLENTFYTAWNTYFTSL